MCRSRRISPAQASSGSMTSSSRLIGQRIVFYCRSSRSKARSTSPSTHSLARDHAYPLVSLSPTFLYQTSRKATLYLLWPKRSVSCVIVALIGNGDIHHHAVTRRSATYVMPAITNTIGSGCTVHSRGCRLEMPNRAHRRATDRQPCDQESAVNRNIGILSRRAVANPCAHLDAA